MLRHFWLLQWYRFHLSQSLRWKCIRLTKWNSFILLNNVGVTLVMQRKTEYPLFKYPVLLFAMIRSSMFHLLEKLRRKTGNVTSSAYSQGCTKLHPWVVILLVDQKRPHHQETLYLQLLHLLHCRVYIQLRLSLLCMDSWGYGSQLLPHKETVWNAITSVCLIAESLFLPYC